MPKVTSEQKALMDILDFIHFHNIFTSHFLSTDDKKYYDGIISDVQEAVTNIGARDSISDIVSHYLLCGLEIGLSGDDIKYFNFLEGNHDIPDEMLDAVLERKKEITFALLSCLVSEYGVDKKDFIRHLTELIEKYNRLNIPATVSLRLSINANSIIHPLDHLYFYRYLNKIGITSCAKYRKNTNNNDSRNAFLRVGLIMEFEMLRYFANYFINPGRMDEITIKLPARDVPDVLRRQIIDDYKYLIESVVRDEGVIYKFQILNSSDEETAMLLLRSISDFFRHKRIFHGTMAKWPGSWGAFLIESLRKENPRRPIYCESDNSTSLSEIASKMMSSLDFKVSARTLYLRYNSLKIKELRVIEVYRNLLTQLPYTPSWDGENYVYKRSIATSKNG
ncbi:hypothetical protein [Buttiauxella sp. S04-F03]|uniref:hypothetical protein n=1 Tax=Buttiauxella sp. S04-F03 TaxID=2904525 RepID=UPI001E5D80E3|nr:hypothetical protein [Buttiauxella sp. S04-F03]MCE0813557.1 hypothetical protein [Buttiauxella sp. S04-F03]